MAALPSEQRLAQRRSQRLRDLERRVRSNRSSQRNSVTNRAVLATMLWGVSLGTVLILIDFFLFGSLLVAAATAVIVYLAFHMQTARQQRWRSLRGDAKPAGWLGISRFKPAYLIHCLTAAGIIPAALAMLEITRVDCDPRWV